MPRRDQARLGLSEYAQLWTETEQAADATLDRRSALEAAAAVDGPRGHVGYARIIAAVLAAAPGADYDEVIATAARWNTMDLPTADIVAAVSSTTPRP